LIATHRLYASAAERAGRPELAQIFCASSSPCFCCSQTAKHRPTSARSKS
jgi:hypothetical protein